MRQCKEGSVTCKAWARYKTQKPELTEEEKKICWEYRFGTGDNEVFVTDLHRLGFYK
jgi:hypothetical protein